MDGVSRRLPGQAWLPDEAPLAMPEQRLDAAPPAARASPGMGWRRLLVLGAAMALTIFATTEMSRVLGLARWTVTGVLLTALFSFLFAWIALAFTSALAGFASLALGGAGGAALAPPGARPAQRGALLLPVHNEDVAMLTSNLAAMRRSLAQAGLAERFDIFVLSDTTDAAHRVLEWQAMRDLADEPGPTLYWRHRADNTGRKAGNIAEWVRRFGAAYPHFLILDADSLMAGETIGRMAATLEAQPGLGLLQSLPLLHGGTSLFGRLQQFASHVHGPVIAQGLSWWTGAEGNYWGHNAMIRTQAFAQAAGLPELPGKKPFGGHIMSHDFVEAALLRRAGWAVRLAVLPGSHEQGPPTLPDMAVRDRRWCQGNLQHLAVIGAAGLHPLSRLHMANGIVAYLSAPLWLFFLLLGLAVSAQSAFLRPEYFPESHSLFPLWPVVDPERALWLFTGTFLLLLAPKFLGAIGFAFSAQRPRGVAGMARFGLGMGLEILCAALLSPITMLTQSRDCWGVLRGVDGGWGAQRRAGVALAWGEAVLLYRGQMLLGLALLALALSINPRLAAWMSPVLVGLILAPMLVMASASEGLGRWLARHGILATPAETRPGDLLAAGRAPVPARDTLPAA